MLIVDDRAPDVHRANIGRPLVSGVIECTNTSGTTANKNSLFESPGVLCWYSLSHHQQSRYFRRRFQISHPPKLILPRAQTDANPQGMEDDFSSYTREHQTCRI